MCALVPVLSAEPQRPYGSATLAASFSAADLGTCRLWIAKPERIDLGIPPPLRWEVEFGINRLHRAGGLTRPTINAFIGINVELPILPSVKMNTRHGANAYARLVHDVNARFCNHKSHASHLSLVSIRLRHGDRHLPRYHHAIRRHAWPATTKSSGQVALRGVTRKEGERQQTTDIKNPNHSGWGQAPRRPHWHPSPRKAPQ